MATIHLDLFRKNPLTLPVMIAEKMGLFKAHQVTVDVQISEDLKFNGNQDFFEGKVDGMVGDMTFFFYMLERGKKAVLTATLTRTIQVVGRPGLSTNWDGLKVGVNRTGLFRLYLENDLKHILPHAKYIWLNNTYDRMKAMENQEIDALVAIEPFVSDLLEKGGQVLWHTRESEKNLVMWCFDEAFYQKNQEDVKQFHRAIEEAAMFFNQCTSAKKVKLAKEIGGYPEKLAKRMKDFYFEAQQTNRLVDVNLCQEWMYREGEISQRYDSAQLIKVQKYR